MFGCNQGAGDLDYSSVTEHVHKCLNPRLLTRQTESQGKQAPAAHTVEDTTPSDQCEKIVYEIPYAPEEHPVQLWP
jgi:hypothetical protein